MNNILNPTLVWLLTHHLPMLYLSADNSCTNLFERMTSVLVNLFFFHVYLFVFLSIFKIIVRSNVGSFV
jgi:hypothetical protein